MATGNLNDYPELKKAFDTLMAEKEAIREKSKPLWDKYNELQAKMDPINAEMRELSDQIHAIERPKLGQIDMELSGIARAIGGRRTTEPPARPTNGETPAS